MARTAGQKRQDRLQEAVQKRIASGHQAYPTEKRRAGATAWLTCTMREALPDHEHAVEQFETAGPAPPRFVTVDLAHIRSGILRHALCAAAADQAQQGVVGPDGVFCSGYAEGKTTFVFIPKAGLLCAWLLGPGSADPTGKSEETCPWNLPGSVGPDLCDHVRP